ncbi:MAG: protein kinase domain-containing protein [bacterium]
MQTGTLLVQRYRLDAKLGEGGMGVVYRAHDSLLQRPVAVKTLSPALFGEEGARRFLREAQAVARLQHPSIVAVFDAVEEGGSLAIVMELVEGQTLRELLPLPIPRVVEIAIQVLGGLEYAHGQGVIHRDLKPENIIVTGEGSAKLMDFGLARSEGRSRLTQTGMVVGTVAYMAPEQALRGQADERSDLYALGCVLYEAVTGRPPFEAEDPISVITQHINVPPVGPRFHNPAIPPVLEAVILRLLAKDPDRRYRSAGEVAQVLGALRAVESAVPVPEKMVGTDMVGSIRQGVLVGRAAELQAIKRLFDEAVSGEGRLVLIGGDAGIGKTRLIEEVITYARLRGARVFSVKCYEGQVPYEPFSRIVRDAVDNAAPDEATLTLGEHAADLARIVPGIREKVREMGEPISLPPDKERARILEGFTRTLVNLSARTTVMLAVDDLHLADRATLELLRYLSPEIQRRRLFIIAAFRDEELERLMDFTEILKQLVKERHATRLTLDALTLDEVGELVQWLAQHRAKPMNFARRIQEVTEGNPYFIEQVIQALFQQGTLYIKDGQWSTDFDEGARYADMPIPASVRGVVDARLQPLGEASRRALFYAAILGRQFSFDMLRHVLGETEDQLLDVLDQVLRARLIREVRVGGEDRYEFSQTMTREALYDSISRHRRRRLHAQVGEALEAFYGARAADHAPELAAHFLEAGDDEQSIRYALLAAEKADELYAHEETVRWYETARELLEDSGQTERALEVAEKLATPYLYSGRPEKSVEIYKHLLAEAERRDDRRQAAELNRKIGHVYQVSWDFAAAVPHLEKALVDMTEEEGAETLSILLDLARARNFSADPREAEALARRALSLADRLGITDQLAWAHEELALAFSQQGLRLPSEEHHQRAIELARGAKTYTAVWTASRAYNNRAVNCEVVGDFRTSEELRRQALTLAETMGDQPGIYFHRANVSWANFMLGDWRAARQAAERAMDLVDRAGLLRFYAPILQRALSEDWEGVVELSHPFLEEARKVNDIQEQFEALEWEARAHIRLGQPVAAEQAARKELELITRSNWALWEHWSLQPLVDALTAQRRYDEAEESWKRLHRIVEALEKESALARPEYLRGVIDAGRGDSEAAIAHYHRALEIYSRYPRRYEEADVHLALAKAFESRGGSGDLKRAQDGLRAAIAIFTDLEAPRSLKTAQDTLTRLGV